MRLDPGAVRRRKDEARKDGRRVEARGEASGNMSFGARELAAEEALAAKAVIDADAIALRNAGLDGSLRDLRVMAYLDRISGRDPMQRITRPRHRDDGEDGPGGGQAPLPALINLTVPAGILLGWSHAPGDAGAWGLLDPEDTRRLVRAASRHPRTRWCVTVTGPDGTAVAHGCARGRHPFTPDQIPAAATGPPPPAPAPTPSRQPSSPNCCASLTPPPRRSPKAPATTGTKRTGTPPAANSGTSSAPALTGAPRLAAAPRHTSATSTTPSPTLPG